MIVYISMKTNFPFEYFSKDGHLASFKELTAANVCARRCICELKPKILDTKASLPSSAKAFIVLSIKG